ncbi:type I phosphomannose isomerase catalytic subunit [Sediminicola luteus]|uniref:Phosphohexomutase n=1 Tax=Sediminicola luteus TaxID=319238 RepID=A0A2A4G525_9FLAO|nr:type I phosphomannose isomerase catalytic subunit [Sediminicola luteus]PCE63531.1 mannose-6-phosphate isomerase [Sediminicola luteus]
MLYPLKFTPILKERLWGGTKLKDRFNKPSESDITGESWELSGVPGDVSVVAEGPLANRNLNDLIEMYGADLLGQSVLDRFGKDFPILIKFIDAKQDLSIQLHPNDALAKERHNSFGKTEMWYVMDADPGAQLIVGFNRDVSKEEYQESLEKGTLLDLLNYEDVASGSTFFINTGKIHAIGAGVLLAEIQQTSDVTYRVYDFDRRDKEGNLRELHTELALDAMDFTKKDDFKVSYPTAKNETNTMVQCPYFNTNYLELDAEVTYGPAANFRIYMCVDGAATISNQEGVATLVKGETVLMPASSDFVKIETKGCKLLEVTV